MYKFLFVVLFVSLFLYSNVSNADPLLEVEDEEVTITEGIDSSIEKDLKKVSNVKRFILRGCSDADLAKLCALFPAMQELFLDEGEHITNLSPIAGLKNLQTLGLTDCAVSDLSPLKGLTSLKTLHAGAAMSTLTGMERLVNLTMLTIRSEKLASLQGLPKLPELTSIVIAGGAPSDLSPIVEALPSLETLNLRDMTVPDLSPLTKLSELKTLDFYGSTLKDFSPLAGCAHLEKVGYYGTEGVDYSSLGKLTQVQELEGGLSQLNDISWITSIPKLKKLTLFGESVKNVDLLAKTHLESLVLNQMSKNGAFDLSPVSKIAGLKELEINDMEVINFDALSACKALQKITLTSVKGLDSITAIKKLPALKKVVVDDEFPDDALQGFSSNVEIVKD